MTESTDPLVRQSTHTDTPNRDIEVEASLAALDNFRALLLGHRNLGRTLQGVCEQVTSTVTGADLAGVTVLRRSAEPPETVAATDSRVIDIDSGQYRADEGPCLEAARTRAVVRLLASEVAERWPGFAARVADTGVASYLSAPLTLDAGQVGALNLYSYHDHGFRDIDEVLLKTYVTAVEASILHAHRAELAEAELDGLHQAMKTRAVIEQAKGILIALHGISADEAFAKLAAVSQERNIKVAVLARRVVDSTTKSNN